MNEDENIDNIAQTFFLLMILCSVISDSHFVIHERSPRIQYLFDSLQALFIFGFTQKQQERIIWEKPVDDWLPPAVDMSPEKSVDGDLPQTSGPCSDHKLDDWLPPAVDMSLLMSQQTSGALRASRTFGPCPKKVEEIPSEKSVEDSVEKSTKVSFHDPIQTVLQPELPPKKKKLLEDREREKSNLPIPESHEKPSKEKPLVKSSKEKVKRAPHKEVHKEKRIKQKNEK